MKTVLTVSYTGVAENGKIVNDILFCLIIIVHYLIRQSKRFMCIYSGIKCKVQVEWLSGNEVCYLFAGSFLFVSLKLDRIQYPYLLLCNVRD